MQHKQVRLPMRLDYGLLFVSGTHESMLKHVYESYFRISIADHVVEMTCCTSLCSTRGGREVRPPRIYELHVLYASRFSSILSTGSYRKQRCKLQELVCFRVRVSV
jgi:hypothetical protein